MSFLLMLAAVSATATPSPPPSTSVQAQAEYQTGVTSIDQVRAKLGKPSSVQTASDGGTTLVYLEMHAHAKGTSFIPLVGLFASGGKSTMAYRVFMFGPDGLLKYYSSTQTNADCNAGIQGASCH